MKDKTTTTTKTTKTVQNDVAFFVILTGCVLVS